MSHIQIAYFLAVVKFGSFSEAARHLFVAQSAVSKQIQILETNLDMKLFVRNGRNISLTLAGEILYKSLSNYNDWLWQIIEMAKSVSKGMVGVLHIGIQLGLNLSEELVALISKFAMTYPRIEINLRRVPLMDIPQSLNIGTLDIVIALSFLLTPSEKKDLSCHLLDSTKEYIIVSKTHPLGAQKTFCIDDFIKHKFVTISPNVSRGAYENGMNFLHELGIDPIHIMYVPSIEDIMMNIEYGFAYGIASYHSRLRNLDSIRFIDIHKELSTEPRPNTEILVMRSNSTTNKLAEMLIDFLKKNKPPAKLIRSTSNNC